jgi:tetratricopeptide (TPR) repeat protein
MTMQRSFVVAVCVMVLAIAAPSADVALAQSFRIAGTEFDAVRQVSIPAEEHYTIVVVEFLHHGQIHGDGRNVVVAARNKELVPLRILQLGPGDFCRLAFQTIKGHSEYNIFYGGEPPRDASPPWTCQDGLLLETRRLRPCDFNNLDSVRKAFDAAESIGVDYVQNVFQGTNPFSLKQEPFLSRYSGFLDLSKAGTFGFITSSQDCSFLSIDDKLVASAPGYHGPMWQLLPGSRHDVQLSAGLHKFQYDHATASGYAIMDALWEVDPTGPTPTRPTPLPPGTFHWRRVGHLPAGNPSLRTARYVPDFVAKIVGEVPLPDNDVPLIGVLLRDTSPKSLTMQGKLQWDFGDGQTSSRPEVDHVYLRPGLYAVKLSVRRGGKSIETTNRIYIDRPPPPYPAKPHTLDQYLWIVETYDPETLDAASLRQMVLVFEAKAFALANRSKDVVRFAETLEQDPDLRPGVELTEPREDRVQAGKLLSESDQYFLRAVEAGKVAFTGESAAKGDADLLTLARLIGPMARYRLGDARTAGQIWRGAAERIGAGDAKAECEIAAADVALNDLVKVAAAKKLLDAAAKHLSAQSGPVAAELQRVWGDYCAATGDGKSARRHYLEAQQAGGAMATIERTAWLGAHARSTEEFLKAKKHFRAVDELRVWQQQFPAEKLDGYWTLLFARYWTGRGKYAQAIAQAEQLQAVNPDSPYIDQLLYLAADSEMRLGRKDRAVATLHSLLKDYPGSPLAAKVKKQVEMLEGGKER